MTDAAQVTQHVSWWQALAFIVGGGGLVKGVEAAFRYLTRRREVEASETEATVEASSETRIATEREVTARQRIAAKTREQEQPIAVRELERCHEERNRISTEKEILARNVILLTDEASRLQAERVTFLDRIDGIEAALRECHEGRDREHDAREQERREDRAWKADTEHLMREQTKWIQRQFEVRFASPTEPPPQRSVTPVYGTPAVDFALPPPKRVPTHAGDDEP